MNVILKIIFILFSGILFLAYGWWDREYLSYMEKIFMLSPAFGLLFIGIMPLKVLKVKGVKALLSILVVMGCMQAINDIIEAINMPIAADTGAIVINLIVLLLLITGLYFLFGSKEGSGASKDQTP